MFSANGLPGCVKVKIESPPLQLYTNVTGGPRRNDTLTDGRSIASENVIVTSAAVGTPNVMSAGSVLMMHGGAGGTS